MPIIGTPITAPTPTPQAETGLAIVSTAQSYGKPLPAKRRGILVPAGASITMQCQLLQNCIPADLTTFGSGALPIGAQTAPQIQFRIRESVSGPETPLQQADVTILDPPSGSVEVLLPSNVTVNPGVYDGEFGVYNMAGNVAMTNKIVVWVDRGMFGQQNGGLPALDEVRLATQDVDPEGNLLIHAFENDLADICFAAVSAVRIWNESQPPIELMYTTNDYPYTQQWLTGIVGMLYSTRAKAFLRNQLPYQAAGVSVDDQNKWQQYLQVSQQMLEEYKDWVKRKKTQINCEGAITSLGSPYSYLDVWP